MSPEQYIVLSTNADGETEVERLTEDELTKRLADDYYGSTEMLVGDLPDERDPKCWGEQLVIIKGEVIIPQAVSTVTEWKLP